MIELRECEAIVTGIDDKTSDRIERVLRYRPAGYQFDPAYKHGRTDGYVRLFDGYSFPVGLADRVAKIVYREMGDLRMEWSKEPRDGETVKLSLNPEVEERWYQNSAAEEAVNAKMGVIRAPTGSGKTVIAAHIIHRVGRHAVVIVPTIDLLLQTQEFLEWALQTKVGKLGGGHHDLAPVTVATTRTLSRLLNSPYIKFDAEAYYDEDDTEVDRAAGATWLQNLGLAIFDECHVVAADTAYGLAMGLPIRYKIGMSASPWRDDNADLKIEGALGPVIYRVQTDILVKEGYLVPPMIRIVNTRPPDPNVVPKEYKNWSQAESEVIIRNQYRHALVAHHINRLIKQERTILLLVRQLRHGEELRRQIPGSVFIAGSPQENADIVYDGDERARVLRDLRAGKIRCVIATTIADMGIDIPSLDTLALAGGGKSSTRHLQRIGRVCRPAEFKGHGLVLDFDDSWAHVKPGFKDPKTGVRGWKPGWFAAHAKARRKIEREEWGNVAIWV